VGATKALELRGIGTIHMQLAGFDLDERADGNGKAATTWIAVELLPERHQMNKFGFISGGWRDSDVRAYLHDTVYRAISEVVRDRLLKVRKTQIEDSLNDVYQTTEDLVWIPDWAELWGEDCLYFGLFSGKDENILKQMNGSEARWWLRSVYKSKYFNDVYIDGRCSNSPSFHSEGVALGFCL